MKNNTNLFKKYIQEYSSKEQKPFAGLGQDLKIKYKTTTATGNDILDLLQQVSTGAELDDLDGLKTRLVRLDKLREFLLQSELQGQEQKTVYTAYTKVQTAIRKRKDEYTKKHTVLTDMLKDIGSNISQATFQATEDLPQLRIAMVLGGGLFKVVKKVQQERKQKLQERNKDLKKDAELYYERELLRGKNTRTQKGKLKKAPSTYKDPFAGMENAMVHDGLSESYGMAPQGVLRRSGSTKNQPDSKNDKLIKQIADDVRIVANYYKQKLVRDKDERLDKLEAEREKSRAMFMGKDRNILSGKNDGDSSSFFDKWMPAILGPGIWGAMKGIPALLKKLPQLIKSVPGIIKAAPKLILSTVDKIDDFLRPESLAKMPGKALDWAKSLPGKVFSGASTPEKLPPLRDPKTGRFVSRNPIPEKPSLPRDPKTGRFLPRGAAAKTVAKEAGETGAKFFLKKIPILGLGIGTGLAISRALQGDYTGAGLEFASGAASTIPGYGTAASIGIDGALIARDAGMLDGVNPFSITEANASQFGPEEQAKKQLIRETIDKQVKDDPATTPAAVVPIAKIGRTSDLKDILQSDSNGLGFLFSLKGIDTGDLIRAFLGEEGEGTTGGVSGGASQVAPANQGSQSGASSGAASGAASLGGGLRRDRGNNTTPVGPAPAPGQTETEQFMQAIGMAETGKDGRPMDDPSRFIRTKGGANSSAYGPYQITQDLAQRALKNTDWVDDPEVAQWMKERFIPQGKKMLKSSYSDPTYGAGGQGDLNTEYDRKMYMKMSKALMAGTLRDAGGNPLEAAADWRFGSKNSAQDLAARDPRYYNEVSKSIQQQKQALAQQGAQPLTPEVKAEPTKDLLGKQVKPTVGDEKQFAREKALEEWNASNDPNKGTPEQFLKQKGLLPGTNSGQSDENSGGVEGVDYVKDPDTGEKFYLDAEAKQQQAKLTATNTSPEMKESAKIVKEKSAQVAAKQAAPAQASPINVQNNNNISNGGSDKPQSQPESGTGRWRPSWEKANDIEAV